MTDVAAASVSELSEWVWREKYRHGDEKNIGETHRRVAKGVYKKDPDQGAYVTAVSLMDKLIWCPAGRMPSTGSTSPPSSCSASPSPA